ncbi:hypothetical protein [Pseudotamlana carrageenivorans]|uniref:Uncharacterized protein n=1 Tax=Pseudotamlana carrageenivorans TaxID=2069432 RepID=A0A2I7SDL6_9FLAO|nr:hypothetical protein [Tamlana carrageenivorans]AUS03983.1 hypothetical protein C1A40_00110 [Tamlana carrageenivorans]
MRKISKSILFAAALFFISLGLLAQSNSKHLSSLVNMKARYLDNEMRNHGYKLHNTSKSGSDSYQTWWSSNRSKCVTTHVSGGLVKSVLNTPESDCGKSSNRNYSENNHYSHNNHGGNLNNLVGLNVNHLNSEMRRRGYTMHKSDKNGNDYYESWWNNNRKKCVSVRVRNREVKSVTSTMPADCGNNSKYNHSYKSNKHYYSGNKQYNDLQGWDALRAYAELENRGFRQVKEHSSNGKTYRLWKDYDTDQCIKTLSINKKISQIFASEHCD